MIKCRSASHFIISTKSLPMKYYLLHETIENCDDEIYYLLCDKMGAMTVTAYLYSTWSFCNEVSIGYNL